MPEVRYRNRRAVQIENDQVRVTVTVEGGHVAEILNKQTGVNPLWTPPWPSIEPSTYDRARHPEYGSDAESKLLAGIMGHNLCLDLFGSPSPEEAAAGMTVHGEASIAPYEIKEAASSMVCTTKLPAAQLAFERKIELRGSKVLFEETVENLNILDRPIAWTQHVTLGPPFLVRGETQFRLPGTLSMTYAGVQFDWPRMPRPDGTAEDLQVFTKLESSSKFTTHLLDPHLDKAFFVAFAPGTKTFFGYVWPRKDFPFIGLWEENHDRKTAPWNGRTLTRGMEFGASPIPEPRRKMIERRSTFGVPAFRWLPARSKARVSYHAFTGLASRVPDVTPDLLTP